MRALAGLVAAALLASLLPSNGEAHGGGLDGYGCHNNRKQGGYHCHRGDMAGQAFASQKEMIQTMKKDDKKATKKKDK